MSNSARAEVAHLGTQPLGEEPGQFIAPNGIAVDSRGDIYVAEVSNTYWPQLFGKKLDHELRSLQKLARLSRTASPGGRSRFVMCTTVSRRGFVLFFAYLNPAVQPDNIASTICIRGWIG
jgi:NHL repeat